MRKRIRKSMLLVIGATLIAAYAIMIIFVYEKIRILAEDDVRYETGYVAAAINSVGEKYLATIDASEPGARVTLISPDGTVLYDSVQDEYTLTNHLNRPEVQLALKKGIGQDARKSDTLGKNMFYCAEVLKDGNIIRLSKPVSTALVTALQLLPVMVGIGIGLMTFAVWFSNKQSQKLVEPINHFDLNDPMKNESYEELMPLLKRIDEQNKEKDAVAEMRKEFSANVSHELKTPLTSISGYAEIIRDGLVRQEDIPDFSDRIYKEANRLVTLINDTIKLSKLDEGNIELQQERVDLYQLSNEIIQRLSAKAKEYNVKLYVSGDVCTVVGIKQILDEMLTNLIENAIKYNKKGGSVQIHTEYDKDGRGIISIKDTGIGIPDNEKERIFERFYRVDKSHSKSAGGTGLGLSIVKHGAMLHDADIEVDSALGIGTTMTITFPLKKI